MNMRLSALRAAVIVLCTVPAMVHPQWPLFRGTSALTGVSSASINERPKILWTYSAGKKVVSSPVISQGIVCIGGSGLHALNVSNGARIWTFSPSNDFEAPPLIANSMVFAGNSDGMFYALDLATGALRWKHETDGQILGSANALSNRDALLILVGSYDNTMYAFDAASGRVAWEFETENYINGSPAVTADRIVFGGCDGILHALSFAGEKRSAITAGSYIPSAAAVVGNRAYVGTYGGFFLCADIAASRVVWRYGEEDGAAFFASPAVADNRVIAGRRDNKIYCFDAKSGKRIWEFATRGDVDSSPVIASGAVLFGSADGSIYALNLSNGKLLWSYELGARITGSAALDGTRIIIGCEDGRVYCLGAKK